MPTDSENQQTLYQLAARVKKLERKLELLMENLGVSVEWDEEEDDTFPDVTDLVRQGKLIEAIKLYRTYTGADLKAGKIYVDQLTERIKLGEL